MNMMDTVCTLHIMPPDFFTCFLLTQLYGGAICGNGFVEKGEQCDCGTQEVCDRFLGHFSVVLSFYATIIS